MKRLTPLNLAAMLVVTALAAAAVAAGAGNGASAASKPAAKTGTFRQTLAAKLGEQLHKPQADVLAAMKSAARARRGTTGRTRADRLAARAKRLAQRASRLKQAGGSPAGATRKAARRAKRAQAAQKAHAARDAWAAALATPLNVSAADVTAALRALVAQRLDSLVQDGWLTTGKRAAELACFDDAASCSGVRTPRLALLRAGL